MSAAFCIVRGGIQPIDLATVQLENGRRVFMSLLSNYGLVADIDIGTEWMRKIGKTRFTIGALFSIARKRVYEARLSYLDEDGEQHHKDSQCSDGLIEDGKSLEHLQGPATHHLTQSLSDPVPKHWKTIEGTFVSIMPLMVPLLGTDFIGDASLTLGSAELHINYIPSDITRWGLLAVLRNIESGDYLKRDDVHTITKVQAYRLEPLSHPGIITVDGEVIPYGAHQVQLHPHIARIMTRKRRERMRS